MRILITGITGFVGSHLAEYIINRNERHDVFGLCRWRSPRENLSNVYDKVTLVEADLCDMGALIRHLESVKPDVIFHLAAQSYVLTSFNSSIQTLWSNVIGTANLLEAVRINKIDPIIHICSSSEVYGQVSEADVPIRETCPLKPASPYAVSKVGEDMLGLQYFLSYGLRTMRTRMFTHSVSKWTPVILRDSRSGLIDIKYISEIRSIYKKGGYQSGKMFEDGTQAWNMSRYDLEVWNESKWTKIKQISCHPLNNHKLLEIASRGGVVDVTDNHSIINTNGDEVEAGKLKIGDKVKLTSLPNICLTSIPEELAWLYGFFVAEGCVTGGRMRLDNTDVDKIIKAQGILLKYLATDSYICENDVEGIYRLSIRKPFNLSKRFYEDCYASDKNKKVPKIILNSDFQTKLSFLDGYNAGDGEESNAVKSKFYRFKTKSPILAMGLCYLVESTLGVKYKITVEHRNDHRYFEVRCLSQTDTENGKWLIKDDNSITKITQLKYTEEVWDFETENHWFHAGIGGNIVHNTGPRRGDVFALSFFAKQITAGEQGLKEPVIHVGNLKSVRTFCDVRDAVRAYWILVNACKPGEVYNIGGNRTMTIGDALDLLLSFSSMNFEIRVDPKLLRPSDVTLQIPCTDKFRDETGWTPEIPLEKTLEDMLNYWRDELSRNPWKALTVVK